MTEVVPCLLRIGDNIKKFKIFKFDRDEVTIGRSGDVVYAISSNMISRCHAIIRHQENKTWTITDNKSLNGTHVNGEQLLPFIPHILQEGDLVQFGVPTSPNAPAEFVFKFYSSLKIRIKKSGGKRLKLDSSVTEEKDTLSASSESLEVENESKRKLKKVISGADAKFDDTPNKLVRDLMEKSQKDQMAKETEYLSRLAEMERLLKEKEEYQRQVQSELEKERKEKENQAKEMEELRMKEHAILQEMREKQEQIEREREDLKKKMQTELEVHVKEREEALLTQLNVQRELLLTEKKQVECSLQKEMEKALEEKNKELEQQLLNQKQKLEKVLEKKDMEQKLLESQLNETKKESATAKLQALKAREDVLSNFVDLMEMELQCSICNELFVKATSLNCAHVFCKLCINQWMKVKKECPNCRTPITSQMQAIALDSYIDKMVEQLNDEMKNRRERLVEQRKSEQDKFDNALAGPSTVTGPAAAVVDALARRTRGGRVRGGNARGGRARGARVRGARVRGVATRLTATASIATTSPQVTPATDFIELSDDTNSSNITIDSLDDYDEFLSSSDDDSGSVEGDPDAYYGGYGRCYSCGMRGHWSNGCPN